MIEDLYTGEFVEIFLVPSPPETKAGVVQPDTFIGTPLLSVVEFETPFADDTYVVSISGEDSRLFSYQSKTSAGFTINSNSNDALSGEVSWIAIIAGESP